MGNRVGGDVGRRVGKAVGGAVRIGTGDVVGNLVGNFVGILVGAAVAGALEGCREGDAEFGEEICPTTTCDWLICSCPNEISDPTGGSVIISTGSIGVGLGVTAASGLSVGLVVVVVIGSEVKSLSSSSAPGSSTGFIDTVPLELATGESGTEALVGGWVVPSGLSLIPVGE